MEGSDIDDTIANRLNDYLFALNAAANSASLPSELPY